MHNKNGEKMVSIHKLYLLSVIGACMDAGKSEG